MKNVKSGHAKPIVCLDAGHYGKYNRSPVVKTYYESEMVWKLHLLLKKELERHGIQVKQTRAEQEKDKDLYSRGKASKGCDLFLSLHSNAVGSKANESVDYPVVYVMLDGKGNALGKALADTIEETMGTKQSGCTATRRGKKGEYYGVLRGAAAVGTMGMIVEHSFHTNTKATKWLMEDDNLAKLAKAEAGVIAEWFGLVNSKTEAPAKVDFAKSFDKAKSGTYKVYSSDGTLNLRTGADAGKPRIATLKTGDRVHCYGYYTNKWLLVKTDSGKTGFCHGGYLVKQK